MCFRDSTAVVLVNLMFGASCVECRPVLLNWNFHWPIGTMTDLVTLNTFSLHPPPTPWKAAVSLGGVQNRWQRIDRT